MTDPNTQGAVIEGLREVHNDMTPSRLERCDSDGHAMRITAAIKLIEALTAHPPATGSGETQSGPFDATLPDNAVLDVGGEKLTWAEIKRRLTGEAVAYYNPIHWARVKPGGGEDCSTIYPTPCGTYRTPLYAAPIAGRGDREASLSAARIKSWLERNPDGGEEPIHPDDLRNVLNALSAPASVAGISVLTDGKAVRRAFGAESNDIYNEGERELSIRFDHMRNALGDERLLRLANRLIALASTAPQQQGDERLAELEDQLQEARTLDKGFYDWLVERDLVARGDEIEWSDIVTALTEHEVEISSARSDERLDVAVRALEPFAKYPVFDNEADDAYQMTGRHDNSGNFHTITVRDIRRAKSAAEALRILTEKEA